MFTMQYLAIFTLIATAVALPASEKPIPSPVTTITEDEFLPSLPAPWFNVPYFGDITKIFEPLWKFFPDFNDLGPRILADDNKFQVVVPVKDYSKDDLKVKTKGSFIFVQGTREAKDAEHDLFASQFFHTYTLPANSSAADVTAQLTSDGYLIVNAPITSNADNSKEADRVVSITLTGAPYKKDAAATAESETPGALGTPEAPESPKAPETPESPKTPETPEMPKTSETPEAPKTPETPEIAKTPEIVASEPKLAESPSTSISELVKEDRKEPTTPHSEREDATENENVIPHGNDMTL